MSDILMKGTEPIGQVSDITADNVEYSSGVSVKNKIDEVEGKIATRRYLKKTEASGNKFNLQLKLYVIHRIIFTNSIYHIFITSGFGFNGIYKIGGEELSYSLDTSTGVISFGNGTGSGAGTIRNNTNVLVEELSLG